MMQLRKSARITRLRLAFRLSVDPSLLHYYEHGAKRTPDGFWALYRFELSRLSGSPVDYLSFVRGFVPH